MVQEKTVVGDALGGPAGGVVGIGPGFSIGAGTGKDVNGGLIGAVVDGFTEVGAFVGFIATGAATGEGKL
jgi:hypothetical protein